jgi:hypothetical protein
MNSLEQFYIQLYAHQKKPVPEQTPGEFNPIFRFVYILQCRHITAWLWPIYTLFGHRKVSTNKCEHEAADTGMHSETLQQPFYKI